MQTTVSVPTLKEVKTLVDARLTEYAAVRKMSAVRIGPRYVTLWEALSKLINVGGKRFRPYMTLLAFSAYADEEADIEKILPAALAQELIHLAMLIHDDIIDRDTIRYGIKNVAGQYDDFYAPFIQDTAERTHMTQSSALLAGDILISDSYRLLSKVDTDPQKLVHATTILSNGIFDVIGGELLDTESAFIEDETITPEVIARFKTAGYSFISPLSMGALLGGASEIELTHIETIGEHLGVAYQLRDDLLGVFGDEAQTGKSTSTDIVEGKHTFLIDQFEHLATPIQKATFYEAFHNPAATPEALLAAREVLAESGAKVAVEHRITELGATAKETVKKLKISPAYQAVLSQLVDDCLHRSV